jgi:zinc protease
MRSLAITEETFENQRKAVQEEKAMRYDNQPYARAMEEFFTEIWKGTGYGHSGIGTDEDLAAAKTADVQEFFAKHYTPNNAIIAIVGDVSAEDVQQKVQQYYGDIPRGPERASQEAIDHTQIKLERKVEDKLAKQPIYVMGWKTVPADHPDRHALDLLAAILLRGDSARITKILKDDKKMILASFPLPNQASGGVDAGALLAGFVPVQGTSFADIQKVVNAEFAKAKSRGVKKNELQKAINQITVDTLDELATNFGRSYGVAQGVALHGDPAYSLAELERYQKVTTSDIKRVARKYLTDKTMTLEVVPGQ